MGPRTARAYDKTDLVLRRVVCRIVGHDDIRVIDGLQPQVGFPTGRRVGLAAKIGSAHVYCLRCRRRRRVRPGA